MYHVNIQWFEFHPGFHVHDVVTCAIIFDRAGLIQKQNKIDPKSNLQHIDLKPSKVKASQFIRALILVFPCKSRFSSFDFASMHIRHLSLKLLVVFVGQG